jgi:pimeloyl-ACP methyl ester carboxylesterase/DNA-binding CsgD family transcriptional regulator
VPEQEIRFCAADRSRVAYATVGTGPPLLLPALWVSHLELEWGFPEYRAFIGALAEHRTVIRYDRLGTGLSDREPDPTPAAELDTMAAVLDALGIGETSLLGISWGAAAGAAFAAQRPGRVRALVLFGGFADGAQIAPAALQSAIVDTVRAHWGTGSRLLADVWIPGADADTRERFARLQRAAATPDVAAAMLEAVYRTDARAVLERVRAPALVVHRRGDRAMPFDQGREVASRVPGARFLALDGDIHLPWLGDSAAVVGAVSAFLDEHVPVRAAPRSDGPLTDREAEVLQLVAEGLSDAEIAARLVVSPHTVHRHVANIRTKLSQPSRAAAAAYAARHGLI